MRVQIDGMWREIPPDASVSDVKRRFGIPNQEVLAETEGSRVSIHSNHDSLKESGKYRSIPAVQQG